MEYLLCGLGLDWAALIREMNKNTGLLLCVDVDADWSIGKVGRYTRRGWMWMDDFGMRRRWTIFERELKKNNCYRERWCVWVLARARVCVCVFQQRYFVQNCYNAMFRVGGKGAILSCERYFFHDPTSPFYHVHSTWILLTAVWSISRSRVK